MPSTKSVEPSARGPRSKPAPPRWEVEVFFDGDCPLCAREVRLLMRLDEPARRIKFTDISAPDFDPRVTGLSHESLMKRIYGRLPDGTLLEGVEVFRRLYDAVGFHRLVRFSRLPGVSSALDAGYTLFAKNRLRLTGRCDTDCAVPARDRS